MGSAPRFGLVGLLFLLSALFSALLAPIESPVGWVGPAFASEPLSTDAPKAVPVVLATTLETPIHPMAERHLDAAVARAEEMGAALLVIRLDTPGGALPSTREMTQTLLGSTVPTAVWVGPAGARAASAGFFLLLAADIAAMAPGTHTGAAHPVTGDGSDIEGHMGAKVEQDTLALVRSLADRHGRDRELAQAAVRDSASFTAREAVEAGLADVLADRLPTLLDQLDGRRLEATPQRPEIVLALEGARVESFAMPAHHRLLAALAHPQIAGLLMALGMLGIYGEISNPGTLVPGTVGAICLILGFFALSVLPFDYAGLALVALALALFVVETQVPTFGVLTAGGAVSLTLGLMMMFDDLDPSLRFHPAWAVAIGLVFFTVAAASSAHSMRVRRRRPTTGVEGMVAERGVTRGTWVRAGTAEEGSGAAEGDRWQGKVFVHGELWSAWCEAAAVPQADREPGSPAIRPGLAVEVVAVDGLRLHVRPVESPSGREAGSGSADGAMTHSRTEP